MEIVVTKRRKKICAFSNYLISMRKPKDSIVDVCFTRANELTYILVERKIKIERRA